MIPEREIIVTPGDRGPIVTSRPTVRWLSASGPPPVPPQDDPIEEIRRIAAVAIGPVVVTGKNDRGEFCSVVRWPTSADRRYDEALALAALPLDFDLEERDPPGKGKRRREPPRRRSRPGPPSRDEEMASVLAAKRAGHERWLSRFTVVAAGARPALILPAAVREQVRRHADEVEAEKGEGYESAGRLLIDETTDRVIEYVRVVNTAKGPGAATFGASWRPTPGMRSVLCHSHPNGNPRPSERDLVWAADRSRLGSDHRGVFAIWAAGSLFVWAMLGGADDGYPFIAIPVVVEAS